MGKPIRSDRDPYHSKIVGANLFATLLVFDMPVRTISIKNSSTGPRYRFAACRNLERRFPVIGSKTINSLKQ